MLMTVILFCLVPLALAECPIDPVPEIYEDPQWEILFRFYKINFNKNYSDKKEEQCRSTIVGIETIIRTAIDVYQLIGFNKDLDMYDETKSTIKIDRMRDLMEALKNPDTKKVEEQLKTINRCVRSCKSKSRSELPACLAECLSK